jgi:hypothetical protein
MKSVGSCLVGFGVRTEERSGVRFDLAKGGKRGAAAQEHSDIPRHGGTVLWKPVPVGARMA